MVQALPSLVALFAGVGLLVIGNGLLMTLLSVRMGIESVPETSIGLVLAAYSLGFIIATLTCHRLINNFGHIRAFAALAALASASVLLHAIFVSPLVWGLLRVVTGFCMAGLFTVSEAWLNARASNANRGQILSFYMVINFSALSLGQLLLGLGDPGTFVLFSVAAMLFSLALVPVTLTRVGAPVIEASERLGLLRLFAVSPTSVVVCFGAGVVNAAFFGMGPIFAGKLGMGTDAIASFMAIAIFAGLLLQWPVGFLSDHVDRRHVILWICAGVTLAAVGVAFAHQFSTLMVFVAVAVYGGLVFTLYGQAVSYANDYAEPSQLVSVSAGLLLSYGIGAVFGPVFASAAMTVVGPQGLFLFNSAAIAAVAVFIVYRMLQREPLPLEEQTSFTPVLATTPVVAELDPRSEHVELEMEVLDGNGMPGDELVPDDGEPWEGKPGEQPEVLRWPIR